MPTLARASKRRPVLAFMVQEAAGQGCTYTGRSDAPRSGTVPGWGLLCRDAKPKAGPDREGSGLGRRWHDPRKCPLFQEGVDISMPTGGQVWRMRKGAEAPSGTSLAWLPSFGGVMPRAGLVEGLFFPAQHKDADPCDRKGDDGNDELEQCHSCTSFRILPRI